MPTDRVSLITVKRRLVQFFLIRITGLVHNTGLPSFISKDIQITSRDLHLVNDYGN